MTGIDNARRDRIVEFLQRAMRNDDAPEEAVLVATAVLRELFNALDDLHAISVAVTKLANPLVSLRPGDVTVP